MRIFIVRSPGGDNFYGVGTYVDNLVWQFSSLKETNPKIRIYVISFLNKPMQDVDSRIILTPKKNLYEVNIQYSSFNDLISEEFGKKTVLKLLDKIEISPSDCFHFNSYLSFHFIKQLHSFAKPKIVYTIHYSLWRLRFNSIERFLAIWNSSGANSEKIENLRIENEICTLASSIITLNNETFHFVKEIYKQTLDKVFLIPNGSDIAKTYLKSKSIKIKLRKELGFSRSEKIILFVGRLDIMKGILDILNCLPLIKGNFPNVRLLLVGDGNISFVLKNCNGHYSSIVFTGYVADREKLEELYNISDLFVLPSYHEQSSFSVFEAIGYQLPLVLSNIAGFEFLDDESCLKVDINLESTVKAAELAKCIKKILDDKGFSQKIVKNALRYVKNGFSMDNVAHKTLNVYLSMTSMSFESSNHGVTSIGS